MPIDKTGIGIIAAIVVVMGLVYFATSDQHQPSFERGASNTTGQTTNSPGTSKQP